MLIPVLGRGTRAQRLVLGVMGRLVAAGIAGYSGDILVGSWPCRPALVPLLGTRSSIMLVAVGLIACARIGNTYTSEANTNTLPAKRTRRRTQRIHVHVETQR